MNTQVVLITGALTSIWINIMLTRRANTDFRNDDDVCDLVDRTVARLSMKHEMRVMLAHPNAPASPQALIRRVYNVPRNVRAGLTSDPITPQLNMTTLFLGLSSGQSVLAPTLTMVDPSYKTSYIQQWNFKRAAPAYEGSGSRGGIRS